MVHFGTPVLFGLDLDLMFHKRNGVRFPKTSLANYGRKIVISIVQRVSVTIVPANIRKQHRKV